MSGRDSIYGSTFKHGGKAIHIDPEVVVFDEGAIDAVEGAISRFSRGRSVSVLMDTRTRDIAGTSVVRSLLDAQWQVQQVVVPDREDGASPVCDDETFESLKAEVSHPDSIVAVGSGVINDLSKWLGAALDVPYASVATAASMNGYTSANIAATVGGVKTLERGNAPKAVLASPRIIAEAPREMTTSGLGDVLAKSVSSTDWYMNHVLFGDDYVQRAVGLVADIEPLYLEHPADIKRGDPKATGALFEALMLTGVAMTMAGTSAPASGGEHLVSHALDMMSALDSREHDLHGRQVGVGTIVTSELYRRVLDVESPTFESSKAITSDFSLWGRVEKHVAEAYAPKVERIRRATELLSQGDRWDSLRTGLSGMIRAPEVTARCISLAGGACTPGDIKCSPDRFVSAFRHAHEIRSRFTILDLALMVGVMPGAADDIVESLANLGR